MDMLVPNRACHPRVSYAAWHMGSIRNACQLLVEGGTPMAREDMVTRFSFGRVRRIYWLVLTATLLVALLLRAVTLWHSATSTLQVRACLWPDVPRLGQPAQLLVTPLNATDRTALQGPWAHAVVNRDMLDMPMVTHPVDVHGHAKDALAFSIPLTFEMAGKWWIHVSVQTPGRPPWQTQLQTTVLEAGALARDAKATTAGSFERACSAGVPLQTREAGGRGL